jgi:DNA polymerase
MDAEQKEAALRALAEEYNACGRCKLCQPAGRQRQNIVFGHGNPDARLMLIGEGPGEQEDKVGEPFVGPAGKLLDQLLGSFSSSRDEVFITNVVMCRPTRDDDFRKNRPPDKEEIEACRERLEQTIEIIDPMVLLLLGETALRTLTKEKRSITAVAQDKKIPVLQARTRGQCAVVERPALATFHPAYFLHSENVVWTQGSDIHMTWQVFQKAFSMVDTYNQVYYDIPRPQREEE